MAETLRSPQHFRNGWSAYFMDYPVSTPGRDPGAVVAWANYHQFGPGENRTNWQVHSRAFVWNDGGLGSIEVDGTVIDLTPSTFAFVPWRHDITYRADARDPFRAAAVHLIPWPDPDEPIPLWPPGPTTTDGGWRDEDWTDLSGVVTGTTALDGRLLGLARAAVEHVQRGRPENTTLHALALLLLNELRAELREPSAPVAHATGPPALLRMQHYIASHLSRPLSVATIAASGGVSESTARRLFRTNCRMSIGQWLLAARMSAARDLLRATNASVAEVGRAVGIDDAAYFSRVFSRTQGLAPREYARRAVLL